MDCWTYFALRSSAFSGFERRARSPILVPSSFPTSVRTSPVASSRLGLSINRTSACKTKLEFCKHKQTNEIVLGYRSRKRENLKINSLLTALYSYWSWRAAASAIIYVNLRSLNLLKLFLIQFFVVSVLFLFDLAIFLRLVYFKLLENKNRYFSLRKWRFQRTKIFFSESFWKKYSAKIDKKSQDIIFILKHLFSVKSFSYSLWLF